MQPDLAMEISGWYEGQFRTDAGTYGYNGDRELEPLTQLLFGRALLVYTLPESKQNFSLSLTGGGTSHADRFSAYRLGGNLPLSSECPLLIPGYFYEELSASAFVNLSGEYILPLDTAKHWDLLLYGSRRRTGLFARVVAAGALELRCRRRCGLSREFLAGAGQLRLRVQAIRDGDRGGQNIGLLLQYDLDARHRANPVANPNGPNESRGLFHFLQNMF